MNGPVGSPTELFDVSLSGGSGIDTLDMSSAGNFGFVGINADYTVNLNSGLYQSIENVLGANSGFSATLIGNASDNILTGEDGFDVLDGQAGNDTMTGGNGADTYVVDSLLDVVVETAASTGDKVMSAVLNLNLTDFANIENLELTGTATSVSPETAA